MRLAGLGIARFIAFTGMVLVNFRIAAQVSGTHDWAFQITHLFEGRLATPARQTLTLYVAHILIGMGILQAIGKLDGSLSSPAIFTIAIAFATLTSLYAQAWSRINPRGPLEALMRKITKGQAK